MTVFEFAQNLREVVNFLQTSGRPRSSGDIIMELSMGREPANRCIGRLLGAQIIVRHTAVRTVTGKPQADCYLLSPGFLAGRIKFDALAVARGRASQDDSLEPLKLGPRQKAMLAELEAGPQSTESMISAAGPGGFPRELKNSINSMAKGLIALQPDGRWARA